MATIERKEIYLGTPAEFAVATQAFSSRSQRAYKDTYGGWPEAFYWHEGHGLWPEPSANPVIVHMQPLEKVDFWDCKIMAYKIAESKTRLEWLCSEASYPALEKRWHDLIAELRRLGSIESAEAELPAEPVGTEAGGRAGDGPSKPALKYRAEWVHKWHLARLSEKRLSAELFLMREDAKGFMHSAQMLRRYAKEPEVLAYIERELSSLTHDRV